MDSGSSRKLSLGAALSFFVRRAAQDTPNPFPGDRESQRRQKNEGGDLCQVSESSTSNLGCTHSFEFRRSQVSDDPPRTHYISHSRTCVGRAGRHGLGSPSTFPLFFDICPLPRPYSTTPPLVPRPYPTQDHEPSYLAEVYTAVVGPSRSTVVR